VGRKLRGVLALVAGVLVVLLGPAAAADDHFDLYEGVTTERAEILSGKVGEEMLVPAIRVKGPAFPGEVGCLFGIILATPVGSAFQSPETKTFNTESLNGPGAWVSELPASFLPVGTYRVYITCSEPGFETTTLKTEATFTILESDQVPVVPPVEEPVDEEPVPSGPSTQATSVDPTTAVPGVTVLTIRGSGFAPDAALTVTIAGDPPLAVATTKATPRGEYAATLKLPAQSPPGERQLVVSGLGPDGQLRSTTATVTVQDLDCADFATPAEAQAALGPGTLDVHRLDTDRDGVACDRVSARSRTSSGGAATAAAQGTLPATGPRHALAEVVLALALLTLGTLLVGLSQPAGRRVRRHFDPSIRL
jgi:hypothetical protein